MYMHFCLCSRKYPRTDIMKIIEIRIIRITFLIITLLNPFTSDSAKPKIDKFVQNYKLGKVL